MLEAITLASPAMPHPNPRVGALVLDSSGAVVGRGFHEGPGRPHAEALALAEAGERAAGGTVVATLEPCRHHGRTPPCTGAILASGAARVVIGALDPDPRVAGGGAADLEAAGLQVEVGVAAAEAEALDPGYFHHRRTGRPRVTLKVAMTLDGQVAGADGTSRWITGPDARRDGHALRSRSDAVMVGAGTVLSDDPSLDVRLEGYDGPQPIPVIVAGTRPIPADRTVMGRDPIVLEPGGGGTVDLPVALRTLGEAGIVDLMVEGGPTLASALLRESLVDRIVAHVAGLVGGGVGRPAFGGVFATLADAVPVRIVSVERLGPDLRVECETGPE
ncbi:MAG: bifunctional diaminohydroxyphosphoribosylaminopyrimidine deaminase/5-amino-6-(5-phosphoribosylamino)uracil reductase RibD [Actinobacteria bacterium]|nr:bifunctional diaminohydroxyphosphoribosylaminopyrimidine deaminase/5-amino-6-(5-phosphoribosylamino)uracil reductase RibD [Actinomycetota bacterium]